MKDVIVKNSPIEGKGVYANRDFKKDEIVVKWDTSRIIDKEELESFSQDDQDHSCCIGNGKYIIMQEPSKYVNHSCNPNTYVKNQCDVALRDIKKGEEITTDYSLNEITGWKLKCNCGSPNCRKVIVGDFRKLSKIDRERLKPYLEDWYKKEVLGE